MTSLVLELFSCSGGMAEGLRRAGIAVNLAFDMDPNARASYTANLGHAPIGMDVRDLLRMVRAGWSPGPIRLLVADPPCTPWSRAGKRRGTADERDMLTETVDLIRLLRPETYLIANVPGLNDPRHWPVAQDLIGGLGRDGYCARDYAALDAANYGVPQHRQRPFFYGHRFGTPCIRWPEPTHGDPARTALPGLELRPWVSCRDALAHLPVRELGKPQRIRRKNKKHAASSPDRPARTVVRSRQTGGQIIEWPWDRPATTVCCDERLSPAGRHDTTGWMSSPNVVVLSERAAAILQGFPEGWHFAGRTKAARWSQIGQAMPPPLAHAVATSIRAQMESSERRSEG